MCCHNKYGAKHQKEAVGSASHIISHDSVQESMEWQKHICSWQDNTGDKRKGTASNRTKSTSTIL